MALSPNFPGGLLSTAQSYPSLTSSGQVAGSGVTTTTGPGLGQALTMSLTSTSSDSEQVKLNSFLFSNQCILLKYIPKLSVRLLGRRFDFACIQCANIYDCRSVLKISWNLVEV